MAKNLQKKKENIEVFVQQNIGVILKTESDMEN